MTPNDDALRCAKRLEDCAGEYATAGPAAAHIRRLVAENEELTKENEALREANEAFGKRQDWWNDRMVKLEAENEAQAARLNELERLCDATYVAQGADAYNHACDEMERWQAERKKAGKEVGTERSLCDGMGWLYLRLDALEAENEAQAALLRQAVYALSYHQEQTRPIFNTQQAIAAIRQHLEGKA